MAADQGQSSKSQEDNLAKAVGKKHSFQFPFCTTVSWWVVLQWNPETVTEGLPPPSVGLVIFIGIWRCKLVGQASAGWFIYCTYITVKVVNEICSLEISDHAFGYVIGQAKVVGRLPTELFMLVEFSKGGGL